MDPVMDALIGAFAANPPNLSDSPPIYSRPETIYGATLPFHVSDNDRAFVRIFSNANIT
jgi:hypothetical protein